MAAFKYVLLALLLAGACHAAFNRRQTRSPRHDAKHTGGNHRQVRSPSQGDAKQNDDKTPNWEPVSEAQEFSVMVDDNINKADQFRHETWKPGGVIEGEYAAPSRDGKWLKVSYRADKDGFHVLNQQVVSEGELNPGGGAADHQAKIETSVNGKDTKYTVKEDELKKANKEKVKRRQQQEHGGL